MNILDARGMLTPAASQFLKVPKPITLNRYIRAQKNNKSFVEALSRVYRSKKKNWINRANLERYIRLTLKNININKLYPYGNYYDKNGYVKNNWYNGESQLSEPPKNAQEEYGSNYTNFKNLQRRTSFNNLSKENMLTLVNVYVNYKRGFNNLARNTLERYFILRK